MKPLSHRFAYVSRHGLSRTTDYVLELSFGEHVSSEASGILFLSARCDHQSAAFPASRPLHLDPHPQRMRRYALCSAPLYTPVSIRASTLARRLLWVAVLLVSTFSFYFPLSNVRRLILLLNSPVSGSI